MKEPSLSTITYLLSFITYQPRLLSDTKPSSSIHSVLLIAHDKEKETENARHPRYPMGKVKLCRLDCQIRQSNSRLSTKHSTRYICYIIHNVDLLQLQIIMLFQP